MPEHTLLGFLFWRDEVLLVRRARPVWQFNVPTGLETKVRPGETVWGAMDRALQEKSGRAVTGLNWSWYVTLSHRDGSVKVLFATAPSEQPRPHVTSQDPTEPFEWVGHLALPTDVQPNLRWLIPMAFDKNRCHVTEVPYDWAAVKAARYRPGGAVGERHFVVTRSGPPLFGTVTATTDDSVTLTDIVFADDSDKPDAAATMTVKDEDLDVFIRYPLSERQILLVAERMLQLGKKPASRK